MAEESPPPYSDLEVVVEIVPMDEEDSNDMVPLPKFNLPANADSTVELWREKMSEGVLATAHFMDYWRVTVPRVYGPQLNRNCLDWSWDEQVAENLLVKPLEDFVWGVEGRSGTVGQRPRKATICGRVFKNGEPAYSCRECGLDNTCVLCVECFKVSAHRNHKYKMSQSAGGGCCDCGDIEAWKSDPYCQIHMASGDTSETQENINSAPAEVIERMKIVASAVMNYAFKLLTMDHAPGLPNELRPKEHERDPLQILDQPDLFCTVLYNDETHTFDQVITTLVRVLKCHQRDAVELVSHIDREGRAMVKCDNYQECDRLRIEIERYTSRHGPELKVLVMHDYVIAHQAYAMRLLEWLTSFVANEESLRLRVAWAALGEDGSSSLAQGVMQNDCKLWKAARTLWHSLFITTMLMDYETKKALAVLFTKNYGTILKDYIRDDHDHSYSISSLSVQLYTTPTLAHRLIAEHDALYIVFNAFLSECSSRINAKGRLVFERNNQMPAFKRAQIVLYDVKYLLSCVPTEWTDELRKGFLHGFTLMLELLAYMQGTDAVFRQIGQHMEFEPEWESAFNLHVKLAHSIAFTLAWCSADRVLAVKAYRMTLNKLVKVETFPESLPKTLGNHTAQVIPYDVTFELVSIHLALTRLAAGLQLVVQRHGLDYNSPALDVAKPPPVELIEPTLRTVSMVAQVHAGMWRRNGYALLNQLFFYHNVKCRGEMLDRDVLMLQIGVTLIDPNEFLIHMLNKFGLLPWAQEEFEEVTLRSTEEDSMRHTIALVEEFLGLLIAVVGSRYVPGIGDVTPADKTKKEIIQALCVKPMAHSELNKTLPEDDLHETGLEEVINEVATFTKPSGANARGIYTLKEEMCNEYDTFYYHYTREELSKSEEAQRAFRKSKGLLECCPPPKLPRLTPNFEKLAGLLQSDSALYVLTTILRRAADLRARSFSETQVHKALHLIGYALHDEESGNYDFLHFAGRAKSADIPNLLRQLSISKRVEAHRPLIVWAMDKFRSILGQSESGKEEEVMEAENETPMTTESEEEKQARSKKAAARRAALMAQMKAAQNSFISNNATLFNTEDAAAESSIPNDARLRASGPALGTRITAAPPSARTCIMCQEEATVEFDGVPLVLVAFVQYSTVFNRNRKGGDGLAPYDVGRAWLPSGLGAAAHVSSCGHALHAHCYSNYIKSVALKENRRPYRLRQPASFDVDKREYLCPLCERLCNTALPLLPPAANENEPPQLTESAFANGMALILNTTVQWSTVSECSELCAELHCIAKAAVHVCSETCHHSSSGGESNPASEEPSADGTQAGSGGGEPEKLTSTLSREMLPPELLAHLSGPPVVYNETIVSLVESFAKIVRLCSSYREGEGEISTLPSAIYRALSYTIHSTDHLIMHENRPLLGGIPARFSDAASALTRLAAALPSAWPNAPHLAHHTIQSLHTLLKGSPLSCDALGSLVPCMLGAPSLLGEQAAPAGPGELARHFALLAFRSQLAKALITVDLSNCVKDEPMDGCEAVLDDSKLDGLLRLVYKMRKETVAVAHLCPRKVWYEVKEECVPFLRRLCLLAYFLSDVTPPKELTEIGEETFEIMCQYLNLPSDFSELLLTDWAVSLLKDWASMEATDKWLRGELNVSAIREARFPPSLVTLPEDYSELINLVSTFACPNSERNDSKYPTMCLVCGEMLCSQSYCCQMELNKTNVGACVSHVVCCGGGAGLFLRVRDCELLLLAAPNRGSLHHAPYLDCYGETDQGLKRGNPMKLCVQRYEEIRTTWLSHGLHEKIARSSDSASIVPPIWQHL